MKINKLNQVMLYVKDFEGNIRFWTEDLGFTLKNTAELPEGFKMVEISPSQDNETSICIFDQAFIAKYSPLVTMGPPSLMFATSDIKALYADLKAKGIVTGDLVDHGEVAVFNFSDPEGNYFAVTQIYH